MAARANSRSTQRASVAFSRAALSKAVAARTKARSDHSSAAAKLIMDSGTTYFTADGALYDKLVEKLPSRSCTKTKDYPDITYKLKDTSGKFYDLKFTQDDYMVSDDGETCNLGFMRIAIPSDYGPAMILGELFMRKYFTVFNRGASGGDTDASVGFALSKTDADLTAMIQEVIVKKPEIKTTESLIQQNKRAATVGGTGRVRVHDHGQRLVKKSDLAQEGGIGLLSAQEKALGLTEVAPLNPAAKALTDKGADLIKQSEALLKKMSAEHPEMSDKLPLGKMRREPKN